MIRTLSLVCALAAILGCDTLGLDDPGAELTLSGLPPQDTLRQAGLAFSFSRASLDSITRIEVVIDGADVRVMDELWTAEVGSVAPVFVRATIPNGRHGFRLNVWDKRGKKGWAEFSKVILVEDVAYSVQVVAVPGVGDARAVAINAAGEVVGTTYAAVGASPNGAFHWADGSARILPVLPGASHVIATSLNDAGDIVGSAYFDSSPRAIRWKGDSVVAIEPNAASAALHVDNQRRVAVFQTGFTRFVDIDDGSSSPSSAAFGPDFINANAQALYSLRATLYSTVIVTYGDIPLNLPGSLPGRHETHHRGISYWGYGLADDGSVLGSRDGEMFLSHGAGGVEYITQRIVADFRSRLAPAGEVFTRVSKDSLFVWKPGVGTHRVRPQSPVELDEVLTINANGTILAHGTLAGQRAILLLKRVLQ